MRRCPGFSSAQECKDDASSFSLLLLSPVPRQPNFVLDNPLPKGGILLNIFGVLHGRAFVPVKGCPFQPDLTHLGMNQLAPQSLYKDTSRPCIDEC